VAHRKEDYVSKVKSGDTVKVNYTGKLKDGAVFDSSENRDPLHVVVGKGQVIPGFEEALIGMEPGDNKTVEIPVDKAYGPRRDNLVVAVPVSKLPPDLNPQVGQTLTVEQGEGSKLQVVVTQITDEAMTIDANHPLAGHDLTFEIELVEIS
jgi:peptidylprolyl isomerase